MYEKIASLFNTVISLVCMRLYVKVKYNTFIIADNIKSPHYCLFIYSYAKITILLFVYGYLKRPTLKFQKYQ